MNSFLKGISYSYNRNIGWQDRTIRTIIGTLSLIGSVYFLKDNILYSVLLGVFAIAQFGTVLSAKCIMCYFAGMCTIDTNERKKLDSKGIVYETKN